MRRRDGVNTLQELNEFQSDYKGLLVCNYSLGELTLHMVLGVLDREAMGAALREIHSQSRAKERRLSDAEIYQAILKHAPDSEGRYARSVSPLARGTVHGGDDIGRCGDFDAGVA